MTDPISDMLTRIRNASRALLPTVEMPHSKMKESIAHILKKEGYVAEVAVEGKVQEDQAQDLKYQGKKSVIEGLKRISKPGLRRYVGATEIPRVLGGLGVAVVSTPEGVMTGTQARKKNLGGELLLLRLVRNLFYVTNWKTTDCHSAQSEGGGQRAESFRRRPERQARLGTAAAHEPQGGRTARLSSAAMAKTRRPRRCTA